MTGVNPLRARDRVRGLLRRELLGPADLVALTPATDLA